MNILDCRVESCPKIENGACSDPMISYCDARERVEERATESPLWLAILLLPIVIIALFFSQSRGRE